jgi:hypothetical protein
MISLRRYADCLPSFSMRKFTDPHYGVDFERSKDPSGTRSSSSSSFLPLSTPYMPFTTNSLPLNAQNKGKQRRNDSSAAEEEGASGEDADPVVDSDDSMMSAATPAKGKGKAAAKPAVKKPLVSFSFHASFRDETEHALEME